MSSRKHGRRDYSSDEDSRSKKKKKDRDASSRTKAAVPPITTDDYYEKSAEFRLWLREEKDRYFNDLDAKDARHYFKKFVKAWNRHELEEKYYQGIQSAQLSSSNNTGYQWAFAKKLDQQELDSVRDSVDTMTSKGKRRNVGPALPQQDEREDLIEMERARRKAERRRSRERREQILDEVAPRETGREAQLQKRRALNAYHKRERSPDVELSDADLMGGGDDFQSRLAAEKRREERRMNRRAENQQQRLAPLQDKLAQYKAKEDATIQMFKQMAEQQRQRNAF